MHFPFLLLYHFIIFDSSFRSGTFLSLKKEVSLVYSSTSLCYADHFFLSYLCPQLNYTPFLQKHSALLFSMLISLLLLWSFMYFASCLVFQIQCQYLISLFLFLGIPLVPTLFSLTCRSQHYHPFVTAQCCLKRKYTDL